MDAFYKITRGYKVTLCKTQASRLSCVVNSEHFDNIKKDPSVPQQLVLQCGITRKLPHAATQADVKN